MNLLQILWETDTEERVREDDLHNFNLELDNHDSVGDLLEEQELSCLHQCENIACCYFVSVLLL